MGGRVRGMMVGALVMACGPVWAADGVLYCVEGQSTGFHSQNSVYASAEFTPKRFTLRFSDRVNNTSKLTLSQDGKTSGFRCLEMPPGYKGWSCDGMPVGSLNFNGETLRFVRTQVFGHSFSDTDSVVLSIGTCETF